MVKIAFWDQKSSFFQSYYKCSYGRYMAGNMHLGCPRHILRAFLIYRGDLVHFWKNRKKCIFCLFLAVDRHAKSIFFNFRPDNRIITFAPPSASISPFPVRFDQVNSTCLARNLIFYLRVALLVKPIYYRFVHTSSTHGPHIVHTWSTHKVHIKGYLSIYTLLGIFPMSKKLHVFEVPCHAC